VVSLREHRIALNFNPSGHDHHCGSPGVQRLGKYRRPIAKPRAHLAQEAQGPRARGPCFPARLRPKNLSAAGAVEASSTHLELAAFGPLAKIVQEPGQGSDPRGGWASCPGLRQGEGKGPSDVVHSWTLPANSTTQSHLMRECRSIHRVRQQSAGRPCIRTRWLMGPRLDPTPPPPPPPRHNAIAQA